MKNGGHSHSGVAQIAVDKKGYCIKNPFFSRKSRMWGRITWLVKSAI
jgi:hypothetical protein